MRAVDPPVVPRADVQDVPVPEHVRGRDGVPVEPERHRGRVARQAEVCDDRVRERSARSRARTSRGAVPHAEVLRRAPFDRHQTRVDVEAQTRRVSEIRLVSEIRPKVGRRRGCRRGHRTRPVPVTFHVRVPEAEKTPPRSHAPDAARPHSPRALRGRLWNAYPAHRRNDETPKSQKELEGDERSSVFVFEEKITTTLRGMILRDAPLTRARSARRPRRVDSARARISRTRGRTGTDGVSRTLNIS